MAGFKFYTGAYPGQMIIQFSATKGAAEEDWDTYMDGVQVGDFPAGITNSTSGVFLIEFSFYS